MTKGSRIRLSDFIEIDKRFIENFRNGKFKVLEPKLLDEAEVISTKDTFKSEELVGMFKNADSLDSVGTEAQSNIFSFFTEDSLGISVSVGHAGGDHAEIGMQFQDIAELIKPENGIGEDFANLLSDGNLNNNSVFFGEWIFKAVVASGPVSKKLVNLFQKLKFTLMLS